PFIAFSGEPAMQLGEFVAQQSQHDDSVFAPEVWKMAVGADSVFIVSRMFTSNCDGGSGECQGLTLAGYNVTGLPLPESWAHAPKDVDLDEVITPQDALIVINAI